MEWLKKIIGNGKTYLASLTAIGGATQMLLDGSLSPEQYAATIGIASAFAFLRMAIAKVMKVVNTLNDAVKLLGSFTNQPPPSVPKP